MSAARRNADGRTETKTEVKTAETLDDRKAKVQAGESTTPVHDVTIPGGKYLVNGQLVNANGERINDDGSPVEKK